MFGLGLRGKLEDWIWALPSIKAHILMASLAGPDVHLSKYTSLSSSLQTTDSIDLLNIARKLLYLIGLPS